jgi:hypothetical protein
MPGGESENLCRRMLTNPRDPLDSAPDLQLPETYLDLILDLILVRIGTHSIMLYHSRIAFREFVDVTRHVDMNTR